jgi:EmrB/QacA subfamily drug resistance transporter
MIRWSQQTGPAERGVALTLLAITQFLVVLDMTVVNVALPSIDRELGFAPENLSWVVNAYVLAFGGCLLLGGRCADLLGRRSVFMCGLALFGLASLTNGLAQSEVALIASRAVQGLGAAFLAPAALSLLATIFPEGPERNKAMGVWGAVAGTGGAAGVLLGGTLTDALGWEWVFWINVPITVAAILLSPRLLPESRAEELPRRFDAAGAVAGTAGLCLLVYGLVGIESVGWDSARTVASLAAALVLLGGFVVIEARSEAPLLELGIFRNRSPAAANATMIAFAAGVFAAMFFVSLYMQQVLGYSPLEAGLGYLPLALGLVFAPIASRLATAVGVRATLITGLLLAAVGLAWFARISPDGTFVADILGPSLLIAAGGMFAFVTLTIAAVSGLSSDDTGIAGGLINTSQQIGSALGLAVLATIAAARTDGLADGAAPDPAALTGGFRSGFLGAAAFTLIAALIAALLLPRAREARSLSPQPEQGT